MSATAVALPVPSAAARVRALMAEAETATKAVWTDYLKTLNAAEADGLAFADLDTVPAPIRDRAAKLSEYIRQEAAGMAAVIERRPRR